MFSFRLYLLHYMKVVGRPRFAYPVARRERCGLATPFMADRFGTPGRKTAPDNPSSGTSRLLTENNVKATAFAPERWPSG